MTACLLLTVCCTLGQTKDYGQTFQHDFRGRPLAPPLEVIPWKYPAVTVEKDGLRVLHPRGRKDTRQAGVISILPVRGDFEITAAYNIVHADVPTEGWGVGVSLSIQKEWPERSDRAGINRLVKPKGIHQIGWGCENTPPGQTRRSTGHTVPCDAMILRLRIKREQSMLSYWWAPGLDGEDFQAIGTAEFGPDDVHAVVMNATTGNSPLELDARFLDLKIRSTDRSPTTNVAIRSPANRSPALTDSSTPAAEQPRVRRWWLLLALALGILVFVTVMTWRLRRQAA
jgi:hypothetical protein